MVLLLLLICFKEIAVNANSEDPHKILQNVQSNLGLHCLPITLLGIARLK